VIPLIVKEKEDIARGGTKSTAQGVRVFIRFDKKKKQLKEMRTRIRIGKMAERLQINRIGKMAERLQILLSPEGRVSEKNGLC